MVLSNSDRAVFEREYGSLAEYLARPPQSCLNPVHSPAGPEVEQGHPVRAATGCRGVWKVMDLGVRCNCVLTGAGQEGASRNA